jgi:hypothetical protein
VYISAGGVIEDEGKELEREPEPEGDGLEDSGSMRFPADDNSLATGGDGEFGL